MNPVSSGQESIIGHIVILVVIFFICWLSDKMSS